MMLFGGGGSSPSLFARQLLAAVFNLPVGQFSVKLLSFGGIFVFRLYPDKDLATVDVEPV